MSELRIAFRDRSDPLPTAGELARHLPPDECATVREIVTGGVEAGWSTVGDLLDALEALDPAQRRALRDRARHAAGLPDTAQADRARSRALEVPMTGAPARDSAGYVLQPCAVCGTMPVRSDTGGPMATRARRWHCAAHEHLAAPGDLDDWTPRIVVAASGLVDLDKRDAELAQARVEDERRRQAHEARRASRIAEAPAAEREAEAQARAWRGANIMQPEVTAP